ncbi:DISARM system phospholipase D-like protein DrmC [Streptomyces sp. NPDC005963]|uniref:DISARM system phospholipase D-like protein DrmC n=1 Tax=Streptomyces sp. NPDC005963 TaxID=3156721 RepID=UPI0033FD795E
MSSLPPPRRSQGELRRENAATQLPEILVAVCSRLPEERLTAWQEVLRQSDGPDDPLLDQFTNAQFASGLARQLVEVTRAWRADAPELTGAALELAVAAVRAIPRPSPVQPVISGPIGPATQARLTGGVVLEVIRSARSSLLIATFAAHGVVDGVEEVRKAVGRGVTVDLLLEESTGASAAFTRLPDEVRVWHRHSAGTGVLHAKLIAADRHTALLGSANLTDRALSDNIELGVVLRGTEAVGPLVDHFRWLTSPGSGVMSRV